MGPVATFKWNSSLVRIGRGALIFWELLENNHLVFLAGEEHSMKPDSRYPRKHYTVDNSTHYHIVLIYALTGQIVQQFLVSPDKVSGCRLEDVDAKGLLVSFCNKRLAYYRFASTDDRRDQKN